eukprot:765802-Hanusia_phi.AAC.7
MAKVFKGSKGYYHIHIYQYDPGGTILVLSVWCYIKSPIKGFLVSKSGAGSSGTIGEVLDDSNCLSNQIRTERDSDHAACSTLTQQMLPYHPNPLLRAG